ncbi:MAG TPA: N-acetylglucosamine-6-phosphate deacetylase [Pyrinomonadaceae bacterium]|nr:N-acetylglucosamine-6-phosphate deacetylase [Pyrinomonadaceae bacterium]
MNTNMAQTPVVLKNARVVLPDRVMESGTVVVDAGLITSVADSATAEGEVLDLSGLILLPGFIDVHTHGAVGIDVMEATASELQVVSEYLASQGVTAWLPTLVPAADADYGNVAAAVSQAMGTPDGVGARILGLHYEGPFVNSAQCGALHVEHFKTYSGASDLDRLPVSEETVRMITLAPEIAGGVELVRELKRRGWVISIGHTRATVEVLDQALAAGAHHMTHFMNAMSPLHHRSPGPIGWGLSHDNVTFDMIADGIHLDPLMLKLLVKIKGARGVSLISDAIAATGKGDGDYEIWGETISVKNGRTSNAAGSIAGSVITMLDGVRMMRSLGICFPDLAQLASSNPARLLGLSNARGSIETGKRADLVALDTNGNVRLTIIAGQVAFSA